MRIHFVESRHWHEFTNAIDPAFIVRLAGLTAYFIAICAEADTTFYVGKLDRYAIRQIY
jgi:hypothetical protein